MTEDGEAEPFREGERDGDLEYDFLKLAFERTEAADPARTGDDPLDLGEDFGLIDFDLVLLLALFSTLADLWESGEGVLDFSRSSSESLLPSSRLIASVKVRLNKTTISDNYFFRKNSKDR